MKKRINLRNYRRVWSTGGFSKLFASTREIPELGVKFGSEFLPRNHIFSRVKLGRNRLWKINEFKSIWNIKEGI